jgi:sulfite oxidase
LGLKRLVDYSWEVVQKEKENMIHLLDFPYNGETSRDDLKTKLTKNEHHL